MPLSMPEAMTASRSSWLDVLDEHRHRRDAVDLVERHGVERGVASGSGTPS